HPHAIWAKPPRVSLKGELPRQKKWTEKAVLGIGKTLCEVLALAHRLGIVHGRLTPAEIYFENDTVRVDFAHSLGLHELGMITVATEHSAPHDAERGKELGADSSADIRSLGEILFQMLHGDDSFGACKASTPGDWSEVNSLHALVEHMLADEIGRAHV